MCPCAAARRTHFQYALTLDLRAIGLPRESILRFRKSGCRGLLQVILCSCSVRCDTDAAPIVSREQVHRLRVSRGRSNAQFVDGAAVCIGIALIQQQQGHVITRFNVALPGTALMPAQRGKRIFRDTVARCIQAAER
jgi:hypothetical protein